MRLRECFADFVKPPGVIAFRNLFMPPYSISVGRGADDIVKTVAVYIQHVHLRTILSKVRFVKLPGWLCRVFRTFPPSLFDYHIFSSVLIYIAISETV